LHYFQILIGQNEKRTIPITEDIANNLYSYDIKPYVVKHNDIVSCITEISAINVINAYCNSLLKSKFIRLAPIWKLYENKNRSGHTLYKVLFVIFYILYINYLFYIYIRKIYIYIYLFIYVFERICIYFVIKFL